MRRGFGELFARVEVARGLGPGASASGPASRSRVEALRIERGDGSSFEAVLRVPLGVRRGAMLLTPGVHFAGMRDPRLVRFAEVLASAGIVALAPELEDHVALLPSPRAIDDLARAFAVLCARPELPRGCRPGVWSVSFGAYAALALAASEAWRSRVGGLFLFGPYADLSRALAYSTNEAAVERDPLVRPVIYLWVLDALVDSVEARAALATAIRGYVRETWGAAGPSTLAQRSAAFERFSQQLPEGPSLALFRSATLGLGPDPRITAAFEAEKGRFRFLEPSTWAPSVRAPVTIVHGRDDATIPFTEAEHLGALLSPHTPTEVLVTGFYAHTAAAARPGPAALAGEVVTLLKVVDRLVRTATRGWPPG